MAISSTLDGTENPLSEGGVWLRPGAYHLEMEKVSGEARVTGTSAEGCALYGGSGWNDVQTSEITLTDRGTASDGWMIAVRGDETTAEGYQLYRNSGADNADLYWKSTGSGFTLLTSSMWGAGAPADTDVLRLDVDDAGAGGDVRLLFYDTGTLQSTFTDTSNLARSGTPGFGAYGAVGTVLITAWQGTGESAGGRTTRNTRSAPLGVAHGMGFRMG